MKNIILGTTMYRIRIHGKASSYQKNREMLLDLYGKDHESCFGQRNCELTGIDCSHKVVFVCVAVAFEMVLSEIGPPDATGLLGL
jgi:hypothetical protein